MAVAHAYKRPKSSPNSQDDSTPYQQVHISPPCALTSHEPVATVSDVPTVGSSLDGGGADLHSGSPLLAFRVPIVIEKIVWWSHVMPRALKPFHQRFGMKTTAK